ncbi:MAG: hypothetical protein KF712_14010 [Akkermansiaceae bacterium]|nr:hypothetical protein [Akkermansiaceae bacterium]
MKTSINEHSSGAEPPKPDARVLTGVSHWAGTLGVDTDNVLVVCSSILGGLAAPTALLDLPWGKVKVPKLDLVVPESQGALPQAMEFLLNGPRMANRQILERAAGINPGELRYVLHASFAGDPAKADTNSYLEIMNIRELRANLGFEQDDERPRSSEEDLRPDLRQRRIESLLRPAVLLESPALADVPKLLIGCHLSHALGVGMSLESTGSPKRRQELSRLLGILKGTETMLPSPKYPVSVEHSRPCGLQAIFSADNDVIQSQFADLTRLLEHSVLLSNTPARCVADVNSSYFFNLFSRVVGRVIILRRDGMPLDAGFKSDQSAFRFQEENVRYLAECDSAGVKVGASVRGLPLSLAWTFLYLRAHMREFEPPDDDEVIAAVFAAARQILRRHCLRWVELGQAARREEILRRVRSIIRKIEEKRILSFTALVRSFDQQKTSLYRPLVDVLVGAEVLGRQPDGKLVIGARKFDEVSPDLFLASLADGSDA